MLTYFTALEPLNFQFPTFPLPPEFDTLRKKAIAVLEASNEGLTQADSESSSAINSLTIKLSQLITRKETLSQRFQEIEQELAKKRGIQNEKPAFLSGERVLTGGLFFSKPVELTSPCTYSHIAYVLHNCSLKPNLPMGTVVGSSIEVSITPDWFAFSQTELHATKWNWFASVWLEYDGKKFFAKEICNLEKERTNTLDSFDKVEAELQALNKVMHDTSSESSEISKKLYDIHLARDFLKRETFPLSDYEILQEAYPLENLAILVSCIKKRNALATLSGEKNSLVRQQGQTVHGWQQGRVKVLEQHTIKV